MFVKLSLTLVSVAVALPAMAAEVTREVEVDAPASEVWEAIGPFCAISDWHPALDTCNEEAIDGVRHRRLVASDGARFLEKYIEADPEMAYGYAIIESPLPVKEYEATFEVKEMGGKSRIVWSSTFMADGVSENEAEELLGDIYQAGLDAVKDKFAE